MRDATIQVRQTLKASMDSQGRSNPPIQEPLDAGGFSSAGLQLLANLSPLSDMVDNSLDEMQECVTSERDCIPASADPLWKSGLQQEVAYLQLAMSANLAQQSRFIAQMHVLSRLVFNTVMALSNCCVERAVELTTKSSIARPITIARRDSLTGGKEEVSIESEFVISPAPSPAAVHCSKNLPPPPPMWRGERSVR